MLGRYSILLLVVLGVFGLVPFTSHSTLPRTLLVGASFASMEHDEQLLYFGYTTLATLGYGDVLPLSPAARMFAILEAILGQLYLAILIARLVGLQASRTTA